MTMVKKHYALTYDIPFLPLFILPHKGHVTGVMLGKDEYNRDVYLDFAKLPNNHAVIVGSTGSGKTTLAKSLTLELSKQGKSVFIIDPHSDYVKLVRGVNGVVLDWRRVIIDVFSPPCDPDIWIQELSELALECFRTMTVVPLIEMWVREGFKPIDVKDPRLRVFMKVYGGAKKVDVDEVVKGVVCLNLLGLQDCVSRFITIAALLKLHHYTQEVFGVCHEAKLIVIVDEAHTVISHTKLIEKIFRETRKFGWGAWLITQLPYDIPTTLYSLAGLVIALIGPEEYVNQLSTIMSLSKEDMNFLLYGTRGVGILKYQTDPRAKRVKFTINRLALES